jgi:hypothetical protein
LTFEELGRMTRDQIAFLIAGLRAEGEKAERAEKKWGRR